MNMSQQAVETGTAISLKAAPPVTVSGAMLLNIPVDNWIKWGTLLYVSMMVAHKGWHMWKEWRTGKVQSDG